MTITIISVGKKHDPLLADAIARYETRLRRHVKLAWQIIPSSDKATESDQILQSCKGHVLLLDEAGAVYTTPDFASLIERLQNNANKHISVIIGGAYGVNDSVKDLADTVMALSALVFPHQLVRLIFVEQLYRAYDLRSGGKYHHQ